MGRRSSRRRSFGRRRRSPETVFWIGLVTVLVLAGTGFFVYNTFIASGWIFAQGTSEPEQPGSEEVKAVEERTLEDDGTNDPAWEPKEPGTHKNILLLGLDDRGMCDAVMIVSYDLRTFDSAIISIKRDTYVSDQEWASKESGQDHLAWANNRGMGEDNDYHAGARLTAKTVEDLLGIDLHAYSSITYTGFTELINLLGGVEIEVAPEFAEIYGSKLAGGLQRLDGEQALTYARHRQNPRIPEPGSTSQDGDRVRRGQRLLMAMFEQARTMETDTLMEIFDQLDNNLNTSLEDWDILDLMNLIYHREPDEIETAVLPGKGEMVFQERIERDIYYFFLDVEETDRILEELGLK